MAKKKMMMKPKQMDPMMSEGGMMGSSRLQTAMKQHGFTAGPPSKKSAPPFKKKKKKGK